MPTFEREVDADEKTIRRALDRYAKSSPGAKVTLMRYGKLLVRARIIDPAFRGLSTGSRQAKVWKYLEPLSEDTINCLSQLLLLTPQEAKDSFANREFDDPIPAVM